MSKQTFCLKTCRWIFIALTLILPISSQANEGFSSLVFCEMANSCVLIDKNDPNFNEVFENAVGNTLQSTIKPTIINVMPRELPKGSTVNLTITAPNAHFNASSLRGVTMGGGVVVNLGIKVQTTEMVVNVTVPPDAPIGFYDISVETQLPDEPEKEIATGKGVFQVVDPSGNPEILGITPNRIPKPLNRYALSISGQDVHFSENSVIDFGDAGIIVTGKTVNNPTLMTVYIKVTDAAQAGLHNIKVTTGSEVAKNTQVGILQVVGGGEECVLPPSLMAVAPWYGQQRNTLDVTVTGSCTHFSTGETAVKFAEGSGIKVLSTIVESETQATAKIEIAPNAQLGSHDVYVTTDAETVSFLKGFTVFVGEEVPPPPVPQLVHGNIQISISNQEVNENTGQVIFTVKRLNGSDGEVMVEYEIAGGTATVGQDFKATSDTPLNGTLTWHHGETDIKELVFAIENDAEQEGDETFTIALSKVTGAASVDTTSITVTIIDDDIDDDSEVDDSEVHEPVLEPPPNTDDPVVVEPTIEPPPTPVKPGKIQFAPGNDTIYESAGSYIISIQRKEGSDGKITVNFHTGNSIAIGGMDFENHNGMLTWADADSSDKEVIVKIINDSEFENDEIFIITLSDVTGGAVMDSKRMMMVTIIDDDIAPSSVISDDIIPPCRTSGEVRYSCSAKGLIITNVEVISSVYMKDGTLDGTLINYGQVANFIIESGSIIENYHWVSNLAIRQGANLTGGIVTGYIINEGTMSDFDFRGASLIGGFLSGAIFNNSPVGGYFEDVFLMPKTYIIGGAVRGKIQGDSQYPALLSSLDVRINSHLSHVFIGANVNLNDNVTLGDGIVWMKDAKATNSVGESVKTDALTVGGGFINEGEFQEQLTIKLSDEVNIYGRILVDSAHVGLPAEMIVYAIHTQSDSARRKPSFYMIDSEKEIYPWDEDIATLIAFDELKSLEVVEDVEIFSGEFEMTGVLKIYFGYRLADGTVVESLAPIEVVIN